MNKKAKILCSLLLVVMLILNNILIGLSADFISNLTGTLPLQPASFSGTSYALKENVVKIQNLEKIIGLSKTSDELSGIASKSSYSMQEKINNTAFIDKNILAQELPQHDIGTVLFDEAKGIAAKIDIPADTKNTSSPRYISMKKPQLQEVFKDYTIPKQTVKLNRMNITNFAPQVESAISANQADGAQKKDLLSYFGFENTQVHAAQDDWGKHLKHPLIQFKFNNKELVALDAAGAKVNVKVSGYLGIDGISVDGNYSFMDGYRFVASSGEEMDLKVTTYMNVNQELVIPLFAIDVPAGIAHAQGGLYLVVGVNGNFRLVTECNQWMRVEAGIAGSTFFGVPTSFYPVLGVPDKGLNVDASFRGKVNGYIKAGPLLDLSLLGWDIAGAGMLAGMGIECQETQELITADIFATLEIYASLVGQRLNLVNNKSTIFQMKVPNMNGYELKLRDVCAYRNSIWGSILKEDNGDMKPLVNQIEMTIKKENGSEILVPASVHPDGSFYVDFSKSSPSVVLAKSDQIRVSKANNDLIYPAFVNPTFPFKEVVVEYADFFNDKIKGFVPPAYVKDWNTNEYKEMFYTGNVQLHMKNGGNVVDSTVKSDAQGNFVYNDSVESHIIPTATVSANTDFNGFMITSKEDAVASVDIVGQRFQANSGISVYDENGHRVEKRAEDENFHVFNLRGTKTVAQDGIYTATYHRMKVHSVIVDPQTGLAFEVNDTVAEKNIALAIDTKGPGGSLAQKSFVTEFGWGFEPPKIVDAQRNATQKYANLPQSSVLQNSSTPGLVHVYDSLNPNKKSYKAVDKSSPLLINPGALEYLGGTPLKYRYVVSQKYSPDTPSLDPDSLLGIYSIRKVGVLTIDYEVAKIVIKDPADFPKKTKGHKVITTTDPFADYMNKKYWDKVNPDPLDQTNPLEDISNVADIPAWSKEAVQEMVQKGILTLDKYKQFKKDASVNRGECAAFIARTFGLKPGTSMKLPFSDVSSMYSLHDEVCAAYEKGIVKGTTADRFSPFGSVTREQAAVMMMNAFTKLSDGKMTVPMSAKVYIDGNRISPWATKAISDISALGIMRGVSDGHFNPDKLITFNEMAVMMQKVSSYVQTNQQLFMKNAGVQAPQTPSNATTATPSPKPESEGSDKVMPQNTPTPSPMVITVMATPTPIVPSPTTAVLSPIRPISTPTPTAMPTLAPLPNMIIPPLRIIAPTSTPTPTPIPTPTPALPQRLLPVR